MCIRDRYHKGKRTEIFNIPDQPAFSVQQPQQPVFLRDRILAQNPRNHPEIERGAAVYAV